MSRLNKSAILSLLLIILELENVASHLCLLFPRQRGPLDVSTKVEILTSNRVFDAVVGQDRPFSIRVPFHTCFRHELPCGGQDVESPTITFTSGQTAFFQWQQNFNHYEPGYPGYMDLAIADSPNSTDFKTIAVVSDSYVYAQDHQKNFTALVRIPNMKCDHCVIRARYNAHKPGETTFLQCADIKINNAAQRDAILRYDHLKHLEKLKDKALGPLKRALLHKNRVNEALKTMKVQSELSIYGFSFNPFEPNKSNYVSVGTSSGEISSLNSLDFGVDALDMNWAQNTDKHVRKFMVDDVISTDYQRNTTFILLHSTGSREDPASKLYMIGSTNGSLIQYSDIFKFSGGAINGMSWYTYGTSATFRIQPDVAGQGWYFEVGTLDFGGAYRRSVTTPTPENLYINFQWLETNVNDYRIVHALLGNENSPDALDARIYTFDIFNGKFMNFVQLNVSQYTFMSIHSYPSSDKLYAFSPGLWSDAEHAWSLVAIDLKTGDVTKTCDIAPAGIFQRYYGGSVHQGQTNEKGILYHVLRVKDSEADMIVGVNPRTCAVSFSEATNLRHVHSIQRVESGFN